MVPKSIFSVLRKDTLTQARTGCLHLPHGDVPTPVFMPVGTKGTVKAMSKEALGEIGFKIILANTYHLFLRPGHELIKAHGGLHGFSGWKGNFLTDSGGYQVFSLSPIRKILEDGVKFQSHIDGSAHFLGPENVVDVQLAFGSDIFMQLDVCTAYGAQEGEAANAVRLTGEWARRGKDRWLSERGSSEGSFFGIVQGNFYRNLRMRSAEEIISLDFPGIAIGGLSVGEPFEVFSEFLDYTASLLPENKPRYVMGIGTPEYILAAVSAGIDMFDCVFPTRTARNGLLFTKHGPITIKNAKFREDQGPIDPDCACPVCRDYSRSYLRHLFKEGEILYSMLATWHNLAFMHDFMAGLRYSIEMGEFLAYKRDFLSSYTTPLI